MNNQPTTNPTPTTVGWAELVKLVKQSLAGYFVMWLGIALAGGVFGTFIFPLLGTIVGFCLAGIAGGVTSVVGISLHITMRGRLPLRFAASFAGATAGIFSWRVMAEQSLLLPCLITAPMGSLGGVIATSLLLRVLKQQQLGRTLRQGQFSLADMMLFTAWFAVVMTTFRLLVEPAQPGSFRDAIIVAITMIAMAITEGLYQLKYYFQRPHEETQNDPTAADLEEFWRQHDERIATHKEKLRRTADVERFP